MSRITFKMTRPQLIWNLHAKFHLPLPRLHHGTLKTISFTICFLRATCSLHSNLHLHLLVLPHLKLTSAGTLQTKMHIGVKRKPVDVCGPMDKFVCWRDNKVSSKGYNGINIFNFDGNVSESIGGNGFEKTKAKGQQVLFDWVWNYFAGDTAANANSLRLAISRKMPLYFQHDGHSRTIIGVQVKPQHGGKPNCSLLILDPSHKTAALEKSLEINLGWQKLIKRGVHTLKKSQYQLCYIDPGIAYGEELEQLKVLDSVFFDI